MLRRWIIVLKSEVSLLLIRLTVVMLMLIRSRHESGNFLIEYFSRTTRCIQFLKGMYYSELAHKQPSSVRTRNRGHYNFYPPNNEAKTPGLIPLMGTIDISWKTKTLLCKWCYITGTGKANSPVFSNTNIYIFISFLQYHYIFHVNFIYIYIYILLSPSIKEKILCKSSPSSHA